jgi:hypothetical protein
MYKITLAYTGGIGGYSSSEILFAKDEYDLNYKKNIIINNWLSKFSLPSFRYFKLSDVFSDFACNINDTRASVVSEEIEFEYGYKLINLYMDYLNEKHPEDTKREFHIYTEKI